MISHAEVLERVSLELDKALATVRMSDKTFVQDLKRDGYTDEEISYVMEGREEFLAGWKQAQMQLFTIEVFGAVLGNTPMRPQ